MTVREGLGPPTDASSAPGETVARGLGAAPRSSEAVLAAASRRRSPLLAFLRRSPIGLISIAFLLLALATALLGPLVGTGDPEAQNPVAAFSGPSADYPMGTDYLGRSVLARLAAGLRVSLALAAVSALLAATLGALFGLIAGYVGGFIDEVIMRLADVLFAFPTLLLALLLMVAIGPGVKGVIATIVIATIPIFSRVARGPTLSVRGAEYTIAARVIGARPARVLLRHVLPNVSTPLLVQLAFTLSNALVAEGALSFLGLGVQPPRPSLGSLLRDGKTYMEIAPWTMVFPGLTLAFAILAVNLLGDELQAFTDPRLRRK